MGSNTTSCLTPRYDFIKWEDELMTRGRCNPKRSLFTEEFFGCTQVYYEDRNVKRQNHVREMKKYAIDALGISECR